MIFCTQCGTSMRESVQYCWNCGARSECAAIAKPAPTARIIDVPVSGKARPSSEAPAAVRRFGQLFGLDPRIAFLALVVDIMLNAGEIASMGLLLPVSIMAGAVLGYITYRAQVNWYGDDPESARIKAIILGLLTAIPTPLPELLYIPAGLVGLWNGVRRKLLHS